MVHYYTPQTITSFLEKQTNPFQSETEIPLHFSLDGHCLTLFGTDNLGELDEHSLCRLHDRELCYEGEVEFKGHISELSILTKGVRGLIHGVGYVLGRSPEQPVKLIASEATISLGDTAQDERRMICFAHLEASGEIMVYKRPLIHSTVISHKDDVIVRGQIVQHCQLQGNEINVSTSAFKDSRALASQDIVVKSGHIFRSQFNAQKGSIYLCSGTISHCNITAEGDIDLIGQVDEYTLEHAISKNGVVRHEDNVIKEKEMA